MTATPRPDRPPPTPQRRPRGRAAVTAVAAAAALLSAGPLAAQIVTDGSVGAARTLTGPNVLIPQALGRTVGDNLFHSFLRFRIGSGESATFLSDATVRHVIGRVTGGSPTEILGTLRLLSDGGTPSLTLINPAGVVFGAGAAIDVPGAFRAATADYVAFPDGRFHADPARTSSFSSAAPEAFGFLGSQRAPLVVRDGAVLVTPRGEALALAGGDLRIDGAVVGSGAGSVRLAAVGAEAAEVGFTGALPSLGGSLQLLGGASVLSSTIGAADGAPVSISAGSVHLGEASGIFSAVRDGDSGHGGAIELQVRGALTLDGGASLSSETRGAGTAGDLRVAAGSATLDDGAYLYSRSLPGAAGGSGRIAVQVAGRLALAGTASISTELGGDAAGGGIALRAGELAMAGAAYVGSYAGGTGSDGALTIEVDGAARLSTASVESRTTGGADAAPVTIRAGQLRIDGGSFVGSVSDPGATGRAGALTIEAAGAVELASGARLLSSTASDADASQVTLRAASLTMDDARITSNSVGSGRRGAAGGIGIVLAGDLAMASASSIESSTLSAGDGGAVRIEARDVRLDGGSTVQSRAAGGSGAAGSIDLVARGSVSLAGASGLSTGTAADGAAGPLRLQAAALRLDGDSVIDSTASLGSRGQGGSIELAVAGAVVLDGGSAVRAVTAGEGAAGQIRVAADSLQLRGQSRLNSISLSETGAPAGQIALRTTGDVLLTGASAIVSDALVGRAGTVTIDARDLSVDSGGIASRGDSGRIAIVARDVRLVGNAAGEAGQVSTSTFGAGNGGSVDVQARSLWVDGPGAGLLSLAFPGATGQAGSITVRLSEGLTVREGGLSSSTSGAGAAGSVTVEAARIVVEGARSGISAAALAGSGGQAGSVQLRAGESIRLDDGGFVSISNAATVADPQARQPTLLSLAAPVVTLGAGAAVSAVSTGNVAASDVAIEAGQRLLLGRAGVSTAAAEGNGGDIRIASGGSVVLDRSLVVTSVFGPRGDGGDIDLQARTLVLSSGFIQANTAAAQARGGQVRIAAEGLLASGGTLFVGGDTPYAIRPDVFGFNVIQAAAPTGVSGTVALDTPVLDLAGSLRELGVERLDPGGLGRGLCRTGAGSSFAQAGRGGLPAGARAWQRVEPAAGEARAVGAGAEGRAAMAADTLPRAGPSAQPDPAPAAAWRLARVAPATDGGCR